MTEQLVAEPSGGGDAPWWISTIRMWQELISDACAARGAVSDDDVVEYIVGYVDPQASWQVVAAEMAKHFPGATARLAELLRDCESFPQRVAVAERRSRRAEALVARLQLSVADVRLAAVRLDSDASPPRCRTWRRSSACWPG